MTDCERRKCQYVVRNYDKERLNRIEAVWQKYKHMDKAFCDKEVMNVERNLNMYFLYQFWQAIRR